MKVKNIKGLLSTIAIIASVGSYALPSQADETATEKVESAGRHMKDDAKKTGRKAKDEVCAKGDAACAAQKAKHAGKNAGDAVETKAKDVKAKVD